MLSTSTNAKKKLDFIFTLAKLSPRVVEKKTEKKPFGLMATKCLLWLFNVNFCVFNEVARRNPTNLMASGLLLLFPLNFFVY